MPYFPCIVLDSETSGLPDSSYATVLEIGLVLYDAQGLEVSSFSSLVRPPAGLDREDPGVKKAMECNHLDWDALDRAPGADLVLRAFASWAVLTDGVPITSYNLPFDKGMVLRTWPELEGVPWAPFCLQALTRKALGNPRRGFHLQDVAEWNGVERFAPAHRALADARTAGALLRRLVEWNGVLRAA